MSVLKQILRSKFNLSISSHFLSILWKLKPSHNLLRMITLLNKLVPTINFISDTLETKQIYRNISSGINFKLRIELYPKTLQSIPSFRTVCIYYRKHLDNLSHSDQPTGFLPNTISKLWWTRECQFQNIWHCCLFLKTRASLWNQFLAHRHTLGSAKSCTQSSPKTVFSEPGEKRHTVQLTRSQKVGNNHWQNTWPGCTGK